MIKKIIFLVFIILNTSPIFSKPTHLEKLNSKYPYALLGNDFGILNEDDLAINACEAPPSPFSPQSTAYPYWQCFETKTAHIFCDGHGYDEDEHSFLTILVISGEKNNKTHEYITRRPIHYDNCKSMIKDWKHLTKKEKYVCVSGPFIKKEDKKNSKGQDRDIWIFDSFKTKKGCESYFKGGCSYKFRIKQGNKCSQEPV